MKEFVETEGEGRVCLLLSFACLFLHLFFICVFIYLFVHSFVHSNVVFLHSSFIPLKFYLFVHLFNFVHGQNYSKYPDRTLLNQNIFLLTSSFV